MRMYTRKTLGGDDVRIYSRDGGGEFPVHGAIKRFPADVWVLMAWTEGGQASSNLVSDSLVLYRPKGLNVHAKLTQKQADKMRELMVERGWTQARAAAKFGVSQSTAYFVRIGKIYKGKVA